MIALLVFGLFFVAVCVVGLLRYRALRRLAA